MAFSVFVTYNKRSRLGEATALRLQTIASLYGVRMELPDRYSISAETNTKERIERCNYVVAFSLERTSQEFINEINYALKLGKKIIIVYDTKRGKHLKYEQNSNIIETVIDVDTQNTDEVLTKVTQFIIEQSPKPDEPKKGLDQEAKSVLAILGIALGAIVLASIFDKGKK